MAVEAREALEDEGIATRVVSMPSWRLFMDQDAGYRDSVLPPDVTVRVSMEAGTTLGWDRWVGGGGTAIGLDHFGASGVRDHPRSTGGGDEKAHGFVGLHHWGKDFA
jgi:transketolase